jgi:hypothetical protein
MIYDHGRLSECVRKPRRLGKDYELLTSSSEAMIRIAMIHVMLRRLRV